MGIDECRVRPHPTRSASWRWRLLYFLCYQPELIPVVCWFWTVQLVHGHQRYLYFRHKKLVAEGGKMELFCFVRHLRLPLHPIEELCPALRELRKFFGRATGAGESGANLDEWGALPPFPMAHTACSACALGAQRRPRLLRRAAPLCSTRAAPGNEQAWRFGRQHQRRPPQAGWHERRACRRRCRLGSGSRRRGGSRRRFGPERVRRGRDGLQRERERRERE